MQEMSDEFNDIVENGNALYHITITRVRDNEILDLPIDNFKYIGVKCADDKINLENEELFIQQGLYLEDDTLENIDLGYFTVQKPISDGEVTQYVCYDRMIKFEKTYTVSDGVDPLIVSNILSDIQDLTGVRIRWSTLIVGLDYQLEETKSAWDGRFTMREMIGYLGGLYGKDAIVNRAGEVEFNWYTPVNGYTLDGSRIYQGATNIETEYDMSIEKIVCSVSVPGSNTRKVVVGTGDRIVYVSNPFMHDYMLAAIYDRIRNFRYRGITAEFLGDFRLDLGDVINVTKGNETYQCCVMEISHQSDGGVRTTISSHNKTEREQEVNITGSVTRSLDKLNEHARDYGIDIDSEKISLVEDKSKDSIPLATDELIDNITFTAQLFENPTIYSFNEQRIGVWVDGKPLYQKTVYISSLPNNATTNYPHGISDISAIVGMDSFVKWSSGWITNLPWVASGDDTETITASAGLTNIQVATNKNRTSMSAYIILRYTKTTD